MRQRYSHKASFKRIISELGEITICDYVISRSLRMQGLAGEKNGLIVRDLRTGMMALYPVETQSEENTRASLKHFAGHSGVENLYSDVAMGFEQAAMLLRAEHQTVLPGEPKTNSLIERMNPPIVGGTTASLIEAGLPPHYWSLAGPTFCTNYNVKGINDEPQWTRMHGSEFPCTALPIRMLGHLLLVTDVE